MKTKQTRKGKIKSTLINICTQLEKVEELIITNWHGIENLGPKAFLARNQKSKQLKKMIKQLKKMID